MTEVIETYIQVLPSSEFLLPTQLEPHALRGHMQDELHLVFKNKIWLHVMDISQAPTEP